MGTRRIALCLVFVIVVLIGGCETIPEEHKGAAVGAGVGAAAGTAAGAIIGKSVTGAVVGGLVGGLLGGVIGHYAYDKQKSREETIRDYGYEETQGTVLTIEEATASPQTIQPGQTVDLNMTYAVLNPGQDSMVEIREIREITHNGEPVGRPEVVVSRTGGTYSSTVPIRLPSNAESGLYRVTTSVETQGAKDTRETSFIIS